MELMVKIYFGVVLALITVWLFERTVEYMSQKRDDGDGVEIDKYTRADRQTAVPDVFVIDEDEPDKARRVHFPDE